MKNIGSKEVEKLLRLCTIFAKEPKTKKELVQQLENRNVCKGDVCKGTSDAYHYASRILALRDVFGVGDPDPWTQFRTNVLRRENSQSSNEKEENPRPVYAPQPVTGEKAPSKSGFKCYICEEELSLDEVLLIAEGHFVCRRHAALFRLVQAPYPYRAAEPYRLVYQIFKCGHAQGSKKKKKDAINEMLVKLNKILKWESGMTW